MTTGAAAVAEARRLAPLVRREPPGYKSPVNSQEWPPNIPKYSWANMRSVDHCGLTLNVVEYNTGMGAMGGRYPDSAWTPSGLEWFRSRGRLVPFDAALPGDYVYFRNAGSQYTATHVAMITAPTTAEGLHTIGFNEDTSGQGRESVRPLNGYPVAIGRPDYDEHRGLRCYPVDRPYTITSGFGVRWGSLHDGVDWGTPEGTPIYAAHDGRVINPPFDAGGYGIWVQVNGVSGWSQYGHLSRNNIVPTGTWVRAGTVIGYSGNTGGSTGPHLHMRWRGSGQGPTDPMPYLVGKPYALDVDNDITPQPPELGALLPILGENTQEETMAEVWDIINADGEVVGHKVNLAGFIHDSVDGTADEANGYHRVKVSQAQLAKREAEQLATLARLKEYFQGGAS